MLEEIEWTPSQSEIMSIEVHLFIIVCINVRRLRNLYFPCFISLIFEFVVLNNSGCSLLNNLSLLERLNVYHTRTYKFGEKLKLNA